MRFCALDIKTANNDPSSICEIGIGTFEDSVLIDTFRTYVDPDCPIDLSYTEKVHGITDEMTNGFLTFDETYDYDGLRDKLENKIIVHHSPFTRKAWEKAIRKYDLESFKIFWLDSETVAMKTWDEFFFEDCPLEYVVSRLGIDLEYPDALSCAITAGKIVLAACKKSGIGVVELFNQVERKEIK